MQSGIAPDGGADESPHLITQVGDGIAEMRNIESVRKALKTVGFNILYEEDLAEREFSPLWTAWAVVSRSSRL